MAAKNHWLLPDDVTKDEKDIFMLTLENIYRQFDDPLDKLIIAMCFELDYTQKSVSKIIEREEYIVSLRIKKIKTKLSKTYSRYIKQ